MMLPMLDSRGLSRPSSHEIDLVEGRLLVPFGGDGRERGHASRFWRELQGDA